MADINAGRLKHLEMLQAVITRMANNSFLVKGWSITLFSAILVFAAKEARIRLTWIALVPIVFFWILDAYFLRQERLFRKLYEVYAAQSQTDPTDFGMKTTVVNDKVDSQFTVMVSSTLLLFHGGLLVTLVLVWWLTSCGCY